MKIILCLICYAAVTHAFVSLGGGSDDCGSICRDFGSWTISGSNALNKMQETSVAHTFGVKVDNSDSNGGTTCDLIVGVFVNAGAFGCVIEGGVPKNTLKYCESYPDTPVYAYNKEHRRFGTFVAVEEGCTDAIKINRVYFDNASNGEGYWTYNKWAGKDFDDEGNRLLSVWNIDSTADSGQFVVQKWSYRPPVYEWYAEAFEDCSDNCNYEGGVIGRLVICRSNINDGNSSIDGNHYHISWDGSKCAGLTKPDVVKTCPAGSCEWVDYDEDWNCLSSVTWTYRWDGLCVDGTANGSSGYFEANGSSWTKEKCAEMCEDERECTGYAWHPSNYCKLYDEPLVDWTGSTFLQYDCYAKTGSGSSASNASSTGVTTSTGCQSFCSNYSYAAWWYDSNGTQACRCYHVCSTGAPTGGGVFVNEVYEQVASSGRRKL